MISGGNEKGIKKTAIETWCSGFRADYNEENDLSGCPASVESNIEWAYAQIVDPLQRDRLDAFLKVWMGQPLETCGNVSGAEDSGYNATTSPAAARCLDEYKVGSRMIQLKNLSLEGMPRSIKAFGEDGYIPWAVGMVKQGYTTDVCLSYAETRDSNLAQRAALRLGPTMNMKFNGPHIPAVIYGLQLEIPGVFWHSDDARWAVGGRLMAGGITRLGEHSEDDQSTGFIKTGASAEWEFFRDSRVSLSGAIAGVIAFNGSEDLGGGGELGLRVDPKNMPGIGADFILEHIQGELLPCGGVYLYWPF